ncbi:DUF3892 domain-containing protein [Acidovorax sp. BL-A-41-H1]|uniref:DUF3892 domain-containing protein n=1 Tax=Acidovorax sp. BL-A-41-H1 TaxID=3421102 RepID=UPI003F79C4DB
MSFFNRPQFYSTCSKMSNKNFEALRSNNMAICQIAYITKNPRMDPFHPILEVGGPAHNGYGAIWRCSLQTAVEAALHRGAQFFTVFNGRNTPVEVARGPSGALHLRTVPDSLQSNNLLSLPDFPPTTLLGSTIFTEPAGLVPTSPQGGLLG